MSATYRKLNGGSHNSSTYHKKDGTNVRAILVEDLRKQAREYEERLERTYGAEWLAEMEGAH